MTQNESGLETNERLYWEIKVYLTALYGKQIPEDFNNFCQWLDEVINGK